MKIVYFGNGLRGIKCLQALLETSENIVAVVVHYGTYKKPAVDSLKYHAQKVKLKVYDPKNVNDIKFINILKLLKPDLFILSGYNQILKKEILAIPKLGTINLHGGKLPYYRGGSPINWQIIKGEKTGGCAIIYVDEGIDTGDIIEQKLYKINIDDDYHTILNKTLEIFPNMLLSCVRKIKAGKIKAKPQDLIKGAYYCKRYPQDSEIFWKEQTALQVHNLVRASSFPLPGAFTFLNKNKIIIWKTKLLQEIIYGIPGKIALKKENGVVVIAKDQGLLIEQIKLEEKDCVILAKEYFSINGLTFS